MIDEMLEHLARNWGNWASVVGLVFSFFAFVFSKRASKAAAEARDSVLKRSLSQEMNQANRTAAAIAQFVGMERGDMALLRAGELLSETSYLIARWESRLAEQSMTNLRRARELLLTIQEALSKKSMADLPSAQKSRLAQSDRKSTRLNSSHLKLSRMPSSA